LPWSVGGGLRSSGEHPRPVIHRRTGPSPAAARAAFHIYTHRGLSSLSGVSFARKRFRLRCPTVQMSRIRTTRPALNRSRGRRSSRLPNRRRVPTAGGNSAGPIAQTAVKRPIPPPRSRAWSERCPPSGGNFHDRYGEGLMSPGAVLVSWCGNLVRAFAMPQSVGRRQRFALLTVSNTSGRAQVGIVQPRTTNAEAGWRGVMLPP
jgi:hypothetical protein